MEGLLNEPIYLQVYLLSFETFSLFIKGFNCSASETLSISEGSNALAIFPSSTSGILMQRLDKFA